MNVAHLLEWSVRRHRDRPAFVYGDREITFGEVEARASRLAAGLRGLGVGKGDRVGILIGNQPEYMEAEFAVAKLGAVRVPLLISLTESEIVSYIEHSGATAVVASESVAPRAREAVSALARQVELVVIGDPQSGDHGYEALIAGSSDTATDQDVVDDDLYAIRYTGGTTGIPKAVAMNHRGMVNIINNMLLNWPIGTDDVGLSIHPLSHAAGMMMYVYWARGAVNVIRPAFRFNPHEFMSCVERHRVSSVFVIPTVLNILMDSDAIGQYDASSLRTVIFGGAPIPLRRLREALKAFGPVFLQVYGTSEAPMLLTTLLPDEHLFDDGDPPPRLGSAGREALNVEVRVMAPDGSVCAAGEIGEVAARGPHTMIGYWRNEELTRARLRDGWVYTGDMGRFDHDGYLYIVDRKEDMIITGGFNVWPAEVEDVIYQHPAVREAAVFGIEDPKWGEAVVAAVVLREEQELEEEALIAFLTARLVKYKVPKRIVFRTELLPRSGVDKMLRRKVREEHESDLRELLR